jgi:hypothetical protein
MSAQLDLDAFITGLPKAELHVHPVSSASPRIGMWAAAVPWTAAMINRTPAAVAIVSAAGLLPWLVVCTSCRRTCRSMAAAEGAGWR